MKQWQLLVNSSGGTTKRASDGWDSAAFSSIFFASSFCCSQAEPPPAPAPVPITALVKCDDKSLVVSAKRLQIKSADRGFARPADFLFA